MNQSAEEEFLSRELGSVDSPITKWNWFHPMLDLRPILTARSGSVEGIARVNEPGR